MRDLMGWSPWHRKQRDEYLRKQALKPIPKPTAKDFEAGNVQRAILSQTLQHPGTILPLATSVAAIFWTVGVQPSSASVGAAILGIAVGAGVWIWNYVGRGRQLAEQHIEGLIQKTSEADVREVVIIADECQRAKFVEGAKEAAELTEAFELLRGSLRRNSIDGQDASVHRFRLLADDTFRSGQGLLRQALEKHLILSKTDIGKLNREKSKWERELSNSEGDDELELRRRLTTQIEGHQQLIDGYQSLGQEVQELITQVNSLETALRSAHMSATSIRMRGSDSVSGVAGAGQALQTAVEAARRVEERQRGTSREARLSDLRYEEAGRSNSDSKESEK